MVPQGGYAPNGNILVHSDSVMGDWQFGYDAMDRLTATAQIAATPASQQFAGISGSWSYDSFGNRTAQTFTNGANSNWATYNSANRITTASTAVAGYVYDNSGNTLYDGNNRYWYDAEGQLCAAQSLAITGLPVIQYVYDAEGARIAKGTLSATPPSYTATCAPPLGVGFTLTARYLVGLGGDQVTEIDGAGSWRHSNVFSAARLTATYDTKGLHYELADPLGTKRVQADTSGRIEESCVSLPFGDALSCTQNSALSTADDATEHHFTGKERDTESGNDYFEARYYSSAMGRFMSPDWAAKVEPVPYAKLDNPQSLNLYAYVGNNPLTRVDADGHQEEEDAEAEAREDAEFYRAMSEAASRETYRNAENAARNAPRLTPEQQAYFDHYFLGSGGRWGGNSTRSQNGELAEVFKANGYKVVGGAGEKPEEWIPGPGGGSKGGTYVDLTVRKGDETIRIQTVSTLADGKTPTPAEAAAAARIRARFPNDRLILIPKAPKPAPPPPIPQRPPDQVRAQ